MELIDWCNFKPLKNKLLLEINIFYNYIIIKTYIIIEIDAGILEEIFDSIQNIQSIRILFNYWLLLFN